MSEVKIKKEDDSDERASADIDVEASKLSLEENAESKGDAEGSKNDNKDSGKTKGETTPHANDVLCGRGGSINTHPGNENYRRLVESKKRIYLTARFKREKRLIADSIISEIRGLDPPGRFLSRDVKTGLWHDIGDEKARDKASQALRENAPLIRREMESENDQKRVEQMRREMEEAARAGGHHYHPNPGYYSSTGSLYGYDKYNAHYGHASQAAPTHYEQHMDQQGHPSMGGDTRKPGFATNFSTAFSSFNAVGSAAGHPPPPQDQEPPRVSTASSKPSQRMQPHPSSSSQLSSTRLYPSASQYRHHTEKRSVSFHSTDMVCNYDASADNHNAAAQGMQHPYQHYPQQQADGRGSTFQHPKMLSSGRRSFSPTPSSRRPNSSTRTNPAYHQDDSAVGAHSSQYRSTKRRNSTQSPFGSRHQHTSQDGSGAPYRQGSNFPHMETAPKGSAVAYGSHHRHEKPFAPEVSTSSAKMLRTSKDQHHHGSFAPAEGTPPQSSSLLTQVAQRILSFDSASMASLTTSKNERDVVSKSLDLCGSSHNPIDEEEEFQLMPPPQHKPQQRTYQDHQGSSQAQQDEAEEEGTEVALVDLMECEEEEDIRTPPPESPIMDKPRVEIDWSSKVGGCHTWIHENITGGVGSLPGIVQCGTEGGKPVDHLSPAHSIEMDCYSLTGTDVYSQGGSLNGSVGGGSLCNVFDADAMSGNGSNHGTPMIQDHQSPGTHRSLNQERSPHMSAAYQRAEQYVSHVSKRSGNSVSGNSKEGGTMPPIAYSQDSEPFEPSNERIDTMDDFMWSWDGKSRE